MCLSLKLTFCNRSSTIWVRGRGGQGEDREDWVRSSSRGSGVEMEKINEKDEDDEEGKEIRRNKEKKEEVKKRSKEEVRIRSR